MKKNSILVKIQHLLLFLYFISIFVYRLGTEMDVLLFKLTFVALIVTTLVVSRFKIKITSHTKWLLIFWGFYFTSLIWTQDKADTMELFNKFIYLLGITYVLNDLINTKEDIDKILKIYIASMIYMTIVLIIRTPFESWGTERIGNVIGVNPNHIGFRLAISTVLVRYFLSHLRADKEATYKKFKTVMGIVLIVIFGTVALLTGSKLTMLLLFIFLGVYEIFCRKGIKRFGIVIIVAFIMTIVIYQIFNNPLLYNVLGRRIEAAFKVVTGTSINKRDASTVERQFLAENAQDLFKNHPIIGYGGNNFKTYLRQLGYNHVTYSHNNFLELLSCLGVIGFTIYYSFIIVIFFKLVKYLKVNKDKTVLLMTVLLAGLIFKDYNSVSYYDEVDNIIIILAYFTYYFKSKAKSISQKEENENYND